MHLVPHPASYLPYRFLAPEELDERCNLIDFERGPRKREHCLMRPAPAFHCIHVTPSNSPTSS